MRATAIKLGSIVMLFEHNDEIIVEFDRGSTTITKVVPLKILP